jgi:hypothetical protein
MQHGLLDEINFAVDNELPPQIATEEDMALSETDKAWIENAVNNSNKPTAPATAPPNWWHRHGNTTQMGALVVAIVLGGWNIWNHHADSNAKIADDHVNALISNQITPSIKAEDQAIGTKISDLGLKLDKLDTRIGTLSDRVSTIEGKLDKRVSSLETRADHQVSLAKLMDPARTLATIRVEIALAESHGDKLPDSTITDYRNAALELPSTAFDYWTTVAAIINYQSKLNQMSGEAPDPNKVARSCFMATTIPGITFNNSGISHTAVSNCVVDLDQKGLTFDHILFRNSVIRYSGGPVNLIAVTFSNCSFQINIRQQAKPDAPKLLLAMVGSPDQKSITVP